MNLTTPRTVLDAHDVGLPRPLPEGPSQRPQDPQDARLWDLAATVNDPEIPVLSLADLGVLRDACLQDDGRATVVITPTYSGCPAMDTMAADLHEVLTTAGYRDPQVLLVLRPAWTTDWMTPEGRAKLAAYGIAPPSGDRPRRTGPVGLTLAVKCPRCDSLRTKELTRFGSTSCKSLWSCQDCLEPFDCFKVH